MTQPNEPPHPGHSRTALGPPNIFLTLSSDSQGYYLSLAKNPPGSPDPDIILPIVRIQSLVRVYDRIDEFHTLFSHPHLKKTLVIHWTGHTSRGSQPTFDNVIRTVNWPETKRRLKAAFLSGESPKKLHFNLYVFYNQEMYNK